MKEEINDKSWIKKIVAFLLSQAITLFGSSIVQFAIIWYVAIETQSGVMVTALTVASFLPQVLISMFAGVWADRHNRKKIIMAADITIAIATLSLALLMKNGVESIWLLILMSAIRSIGTGIQTPAVSALIPQLVPEDKLMKVNGINGSMQSIINLVAPAASGALLAYGAIYNLMFIDVVTAIIGNLIFIFIPIANHAKANENDKTKYFEDLKEGIKYSFSHKFIRQTLIFYMFLTIMIVPAAFLNVLLVTRVFGDSYWYLTLNEIFFFVGAMFGGILLGVWKGFDNRLGMLVLGLAIFGICTIAIGFTNVFWLYLMIMIINGISMPLCNTPVMVLIQEKVDTNMQGRVFSLIQIVFSLFMPIGMIIFGPMSDVVPIQTLMIGSGIALLILAVAIRMNSTYYIHGQKDDKTV